MAQGPAAQVAAAALTWAGRRGWLVAGLVGFAVFSWLHSVPTFPDPDAYYHGAMAQAAWRGELPTALPQAWFTELRTQFYDQHLLYHYILAPFVALLGVPLGLKLASALLGGVAIASLYAAARALGARYAWVAVAVALATPAWLYRIGLVKVTPLAVAAVLFGVVLAVRRRPLALAMLSLVFTYVYIGFTMLPLVVSVMLAADWAATRGGGNSRRVATAAAAWIGAALGFVVNPNFPESIGQFVTQFLAIGVVNQGGIGVAAEWQPVTTTWLIRYGAVPVAALAAGLVAAVLAPRRRAAAGLAAVALCAFAATVKTRRYIEYAAPFVALAFVIAVPLEPAARALRQWWGRRAGRIALGVATLAIAVGTVSGIQVTRRGLSKFFPAAGLGGACTWLQQNVAPGTMVYNVNWGEWPLLYSCRADLRYTAGLDMRFMHRPYPELAERYEGVARGRVGGAELVRTIADDFGASFAVVTENNTTTEASLGAAGVRRVYHDARASIYAVR